MIEVAVYQKRGHGTSSVGSGQLVALPHKGDLIYVGNQPWQVLYNVIGLDDTVVDVYVREEE
jgi:hypothetical protein